MCTPPLPYPTGGDCVFLSRMDSPTGVGIADQCGGHSVTATAGVRLAPIAYCGGALEVPGPDRIDVGGDSGFDLFTNPVLTVEAWVYPTGTDGSGATAGPKPTILRHVEHQYRLWIYDSRIGASMGLTCAPFTGYRWALDPDPAPLNRWVHVLAVIDRTAARVDLYVDGVLKASATSGGCSVPPSPSSAGLLISPSGDSFLGYIDEIRIRRGAHPPGGAADSRVMGLGAWHSCAEGSTGGIYCWGRNNQGQLGDGTTMARPSPTLVTGLSGAAGLAGGFEHTVSRQAGGAAHGWGDNASGQLGDGSTMDRPSATAALVTDALDLDTGPSNDYRHTCAVRPTGTVSCWGDGDSGQLGNGGFTDSPTPVSVSGLSAASRVATGAAHSCALRTAGTVACWGSNTYDELGPSASGASATPIEVPGITDGIDISAGGRHTCVLRATGEVLCWGVDQSGQLGDGTAASPFSRATPMPVTGLTGAAQVVCAYHHTCARLSNGQVRCWGLGSDRGQLGNGVFADSATPVAVIAPAGEGGNLADAVFLGAGDSHTCAFRSSGAMVCWGLNSDGQLGNGLTASSATPVLVSGLP